MKKQTVVVVFAPVIHRGYLDFLRKSGARTVCLIEPDDVPELEYLKREIRAIRFEEARTILASLGFEVHRFGSSVDYLKSADLEIVMPNEDASHVIHKKHFQRGYVTFVDTFLRWDWKKSVAFAPAQPDADRVIRSGMIETEKVSRYMQSLVQEQSKSSDWWRQVAGMVLCVSGQVIVAHNKHLPNEYVPYIDGDPRNNFGPGECIEISTAVHAEIALLAEAAKRGVPLDGADMLVTTFPCAGCAKAVSLSGIRRVFFAGGYSNLNGVKDLRAAKVELIYVEQ